MGGNHTRDARNDGTGRKIAIHGGYRHFSLEFPQKANVQPIDETFAIPCVMIFPDPLFQAETMNERPQRLSGIRNYFLHMPSPHARHEEPIPGGEVERYFNEILAEAMENIPGEIREDWVNYFADWSAQNLPGEMTFGDLQFSASHILITFATLLKERADQEVREGIFEKLRAWKEWLPVEELERRLEGLCPNGAPLAALHRCKIGEVLAGLELAAEEDAYITEIAPSDHGGRWTDIVPSRPRGLPPGQEAEWDR